MKTPFTTEQFFDVFYNYNTSLFPLQLLILALGMVIVAAIHSKRERYSYLTGVLLGILWIWTGLIYHIRYFTSINAAAYGFGGLFIIQGLLFTIESVRRNLYFEFRKRTRDYIGYFLIIFGLIIYPITGYLIEGDVQHVISLGLPCPTVIFTFGVLLLTYRKFSRYLLIIPTIWAIIGTGAAIHFGVPQDYMLIVSAIIALIFLIRRT